jgi:acetolactate synthase-1/2/3 large subunit
MSNIEIIAEPIKPTPLAKTSVSGSVAVLEAFLAEGVDTIFGYPGGGIIQLYDAFDGIVVRHILSLHEQVSVFAFSTHMAIFAK